MQGIDISRWQGVIDWDKVKKAKEFAIIKASGGDDGLYPDGQFVRNRDEARRVGIPRGFYHFAGGVFTPEREAQHFASVVGGLQKGELVVLDWEVPHANIVDWCLRFLKEAERLFGVKPLIYLNGSTARGLNWQPVVDGNYGLWIAQWGNNDDQPDAEPSSGQWPFWAIWQYSSTGRVPGIAGRVDLDQFNGDATQFAKYGAGSDSKPVAPPKPEKPQATGEEYVVQAGDTLSAIAPRYQITWQELYRLNADRIANPNTIYPGQKLRVPKGGTGITGARTHTVQPGDTLSGIAGQYGTSWQKIYNANRGVIGADPNKIFPGQVLVIQ